MKEEVGLNKAQWLIEPGCVVMVTSGTMDKANVMTVSWQTPVNGNDPCLVLLVMHHDRYTYDLIKQNRQLVINIPGETLLEQTHFVGSVTGKDRDKLRDSGLTPVPAKFVEPPLIRECAGHLECRVVDVVKMQLHDLLIGEVLRAVADTDVFDGKWIPERFQTLHYLGGTSYGALGRTVRAQGKR